MGLTDEAYRVGTMRERQALEARIAHVPQNRDTPEATDARTAQRILETWDAGIPEDKSA